MSLADRLRDYSPYFLAPRANMQPHAVQAYACGCRIDVSDEQQQKLQWLISEIDAGRLVAPPPPNQWTYCTVAEARSILESMPGYHERRRVHFGLHENTYASVMNPDGNPSVYTLLKIKRVHTNNTYSPGTTKRAKGDTAPSAETDNQNVSLRDQLQNLRNQLDAIIATLS